MMAPANPPPLSPIMKKAPCQLLWLSLVLLSKRFRRRMRVLEMSPFQSSPSYSTSCIELQRTVPTSEKMVCQVDDNGKGQRT